ncbi:GAF domain-containing protein [Ochrobactrum chromiisoli]|uniref:GAF domain-containing protein n=1 Tax=Ochrobactrum chromiisoli TaxID=2993941 RepID=A0ABT3QSJ9_9HYPH|nr:GAF domain-containing protein [Ochrobactrum chromiisoli]MCX2698591.1 GAF domain-containing protein [Ochrobactrum chromiisoli]
MNNSMKHLVENVQKEVPFILLTLLAVDGDELTRIYSNLPEHFPVGGRKKMQTTPWGTLVLQRQHNYLAKDKEGLRWAFSDHALTESLGGGSQINVPIVRDGRTLGTINLTHEEHFYDENHLRAVEDFTKRHHSELIGIFDCAREN